VVAAASAIADGLEREAHVPAAVLREIVDFMRNFADRCHHGKEEDLLFPALMSKGVTPTGCPLGVLVSDHNRGRTLVGNLEAAIDGYGAGQEPARAVVVESLRGIVDLYPGHIWKEDYMLFPMTNKILGVEERLALLTKFDGVDARMGAGAYDRYHAIAEHLEREYVGRH
jgi:hemerythrin-like domain-containing protein